MFGYSNKTYSIVQTFYMVAKLTRDAFLVLLYIASCNLGYLSLSVQCSFLICQLAGSLNKFQRNLLCLKFLCNSQLGTGNILRGIIPWYSVRSCCSGEPEWYEQLEIFSVWPLAWNMLKPVMRALWELTAARPTCADMQLMSVLAWVPSDRLRTCQYSLWLQMRGSPDSFGLVSGEITQSYGRSPTIWDHILLTQVNASHLTPSRKAGTSIYLSQRMEI